ncbi:MAG: hypothetical protein CSA50_05610 [Gammaproteobacteria bacterium]|nr:MAG: hypothetical protein CSA50_05610 [Gammaproteobacteria bacterium]
MADIHIEDFCKDIAKILLQLFNSFPRPCNIYVEDIAGEDSPDEFGLHSDRHLACFGAMIWLADEGYIRYIDTIKQDALDQAVLTHKTLCLLSRACTDKHLLSEHCQFDEANTLTGEQPAETLLDQQAHISIIRAALKSGSSTRINRVIQALIVQAYSQN